MFADEIPEIKDEILEKYTIISTITAGDDAEFLVSVGPEFVFLENLDSIGEFIEEYEIDEEDVASRITSYNVCYTKLLRDNLVKGASGQAIQNMNLMCGFKETEGLWSPAILP